MNTYAMVNKNKVIDVLHGKETEPKWPPAYDGTPVVAIVCDETVTIGMMYDPETGEFRISKTVIPVPVPLTEQEELAIDTALNVEYIACLLEEMM